jgi:hypothetical protein
MRRILVGLIAAISVGPPAMAQAAAPHLRFAGHGVELTLQGRTIQQFRIRLVYVCGPTGGQRVSTTLKLRGLAVSPAGQFRWHFELGPLVLDLVGKVAGHKATGTASGFGDVGAGSSDCGTGPVRWTATRP